MSEGIGIKELAGSCSAAILCHSSEDVHMLADIVEASYPGYGYAVKTHGSNVDASRYNGNFCIRIDQFIGCTSLDVGHASAEWYRQKGRRIVGVYDIFDDNGRLDLGEIKANGVDVSAFLLGDMKS